MAIVETCVCCGEIIPEGRQVCPKCERSAGPWIIDAGALLQEIDKIPFRTEQKGITGAIVKEVVEAVKEIIKAAPNVAGCDRKENQK